MCSNFRPTLALCDVGDYTRTPWNRYKVGEAVTYYLALEFARGGPPFDEGVMCRFEAVQDPEDEFAASTTVLLRVS